MPAPILTVIAGFLPIKDALLLVQSSNSFLKNDSFVNVTFCLEKNKNLRDVFTKYIQKQLLTSQPIEFGIFTPECRRASVKKVEAHSIEAFNKLPEEMRQVFPHLRFFEFKGSREGSGILPESIIAYEPHPKTAPEVQKAL
jgi:hypothetical protein